MWCISFGKAADAQVSDPAFQLKKCKILHFVGGRTSTKAKTYLAWFTLHPVLTMLVRSLFH